MYLPKSNQETDIPFLHSLIRTHPLGTWITRCDDELTANAIPFLLDTNAGESGMLIGHVARANPVWQEFSKAEDSLVLFHGAQAYISPNWYPSKHATGKAVPTWNYALIQVHGMPRIVEDKVWLRQHVTELTNTHEAQFTAPWQVSDAPDDYIDTMLGGIVGIEIRITRITGKLKASQNKTPEDRRGTQEGLKFQGSPEALEMVAYISRSDS